MLSTYDGYRYYARNLDTSARRVMAQQAVQRDTDYYRANIGKVKSADDFIANYRLYRYAMTSFGLEDAIDNRGFMRKVLTSDLSDAKSFANTLSDRRYRTMAAAYGFASNGKVVSTVAAQDGEQEDETLGLYSRQSFVGTDKAADIAYYRSRIGKVTSLKGLEGDARLFRIALQAYGMDPSTVSAGTVGSLLESDLSDPASAANRSGSAANAAQSLSATDATATRYAAAAGSTAASRAEGAVETAYYRRAVPDVTSVDAFLSDDRLQAYACKAFGLDPDKDAAAQAYALGRGLAFGTAFTKAQRSDLLRAVLTSDLSDTSSVAATLGGGYREMAQAFGFGAARLQSPGDSAGTVARYGQSGGSDAAESAYYAATVPGLSAPAQFVADPRLLAYVTKAYGLTFPAGTTDGGQRDAVLAALGSDPTDPQGAAAKLGPAFVALASAFNSARVVGAQLAAASESTVDLYGQASAGDADAAAETKYFMDTMPGIKTVDALLADTRLAAYVTKAYGATAAAGGSTAQTRERLRAVLVSDPSDPEGDAAQGGDAARRLASAFRFGADGTAARQPRAAPPATRDAQTAAAVEATADLYTERLGTDASKRAQGAVETGYYRAAIGAVRSVDDVLADDRLVAYVTAAYGVAVPDGLSDDDRASLLRGILSSDPGDPKSIASLQGDGARALAAAFSFGHVYDGDAALSRDGRPDLVSFASAFNFDAQGRVTNPRLAQSERETAATLKAFKAGAPAAGVGTAEAKADASYYQASIGRVRTLDGFLSDPRLVAVATVAAGVARPAGLSDRAWTARLRSALTTDLARAGSGADVADAPLRRLAASFDFARDGTVARVPAQRAQFAGAAAILEAPHTEQVMEDQAGAADPGVKLALYFKRVAPSVTSPYAILADKQLLSVVETALGLPTNFSKIDIDAQARMIGAKVKLADFSDAKKLDTFVKRFAVLYDAARAKAKSSATVFDDPSSAARTSANTLLDTLHPTPAGDGTSSLLQLFTHAS